MTGHKPIKKGMQKMVTIRMEAKMQKALKRLSEKEFTSVSGLLKKAAEKLLQEHGIDWREIDISE